MRNGPATPRSVKKEEEEVLQGRYSSAAGGETTVEQVSTLQPVEGPTLEQGKSVRR